MDPRLKRLQGLVDKWDRLGSSYGDFGQCARELADVLASPLHTGAGHNLCASKLHPAAKPCTRPLGHASLHGNEFDGEWADTDVALHAGAEPEKSTIDDLLVEVYQLAKDHWCAQCYGFTGAPEHVKRGAHEAALEGFDAICKKLGPVVHPIFDAEYKAAAALSSSRTALEGPKPDGK